MVGGITHNLFPKIRYKRNIFERRSKNWSSENIQRVKDTGAMVSFLRFYLGFSRKPVLFVSRLNDNSFPPLDVRTASLYHSPTVLMHGLKRPFYRPFTSLLPSGQQSPGESLAFGVSD